MTDWCPVLSTSNAPRYVAIADSIETDIAAGRLVAGDRLPAQRQLAGSLGLDFTTVARGYAEARRRGLVASQVGSGTYVTSSRTEPGKPAQESSSARRLSAPDQSMNLPPEADAPNLIARIKAGFSSLSEDPIALMRYQNLEASDMDREAAALWLDSAGLSRSSSEILFAPGTQAALTAALSVLTRPGDTIACDALTYPGIRSICAQMNLDLKGLAPDDDGLDPDAFAALCQTQAPKALYLNPTLHNPTTRTMPAVRRKELADIARRYGVPVLEDDACGHLVEERPPSFAALAPDITWHFSSLSKCIGAGLRLAYVLEPDRKAAWQLSRSIRTNNVMASPLSVALATHWIGDGTAHDLRSFIRRESHARQKIASDYLRAHDVQSDKNGFHLWLKLPHGWTRSTFVGQMRNLRIGLVESDAFAAGPTPPEAVRICLGGPVARADLHDALDTIAHTLAASPQRASAYF